MLFVRGIRKWLIFFWGYFGIYWRGVDPTSVNWGLSTCPQPAPVPNAFRDVSNEYDVTYTCYDGYAITSGDLRRQCFSAGSYSGETPTCVMTCQEPIAEEYMILMPAVQPTVAGDTVTQYCLTGNTYGGPEHITCSEHTGQWEPWKAFCCGIVKVRDVKLSTTDSAEDCQWTTEAEERPYLTGRFFPSALHDVAAVMVTVGESHEEDGANFTVDIVGDSVLPCGQFTSSPSSRYTNLKCQLIEGVLPWGYEVKVTADFPGGERRQLVICSLSVHGRRHSGRCPFPPVIPRLQLQTDVTQFYRNDTVVYSCAHRLLPLAGSGRSQCSPFGEWSYPSLVCTDETNLASGMPVTVMTSLGMWKEKPGLANLTDNDVSTGVRHDPDDVRYRVNLTTVAEIQRVVVTTSGPLDLTIKTFSSATGSAHLCDVSDLSEAELTSVECHMFLGDALFLECNASHGYLIEVRVFGRVFDKPLSCLRTASGNDYKGYVSVTTSGRSCLRWADIITSDLPPRFDPQSLPDESVEDAASFCRNPQGERPGVVCYVRDAERKVIPELCDVPLCATHCRLREDGQDYRGSLNVTKDGRACVDWNHPNIPFRRKEDFDWLSRGRGGNGAGDEASGDWTNHNHCRNPGGSQSGLWCYTNADTLDYGFCHVSLCGADELPSRSMPASVSSASFPSADTEVNPSSSAASEATRTLLQPASSDVTIIPSQIASSDVTIIPSQTASSDLTIIPSHLVTSDIMRTLPQPASNGLTITPSQPASIDVTRAPPQPVSSDAGPFPRRTQATSDVMNSISLLPPAVSDTIPFFTRSCMESTGSSLLSMPVTRIPCTSVQTKDIKSEFDLATATTISPSGKSQSSLSARATTSFDVLQNSVSLMVRPTSYLQNRMTLAVATPDVGVLESFSSITSSFKDLRSSTPWILSSFFADHHQNSESSSIVGHFDDLQSSMSLSFSPFGDLQSSIFLSVTPNGDFHSSVSSVLRLADLEPSTFASLSTGSSHFPFYPAANVSVSVTSPPNGSETEASSTARSIPISPTTVSGSQDLEGSSRRTRLCPCSCAARGRDVEDKASLSSRVQDLKNSLHVPTSNLSASRRRRISAPDNRTSSVVAGVLGVLLIGLVVLFLVAADVMSFFMFMMDVIKRRLDAESIR